VYVHCTDVQIVAGFLPAASEQMVTFQHSNEG